MSGIRLLKLSTFLAINYTFGFYIMTVLRIRTAKVVSYKRPLALTSPPQAPSSRPNTLERRGTPKPRASRSVPYLPYYINVPVGHYA
jgi:hypothetical protein